MLKSLPLLAAIVFFMTASAGFTQDVEAGKVAFKKCVACHKIGPDAKNLVGPILTGVVGRKAGSVEGFKYRNSIVTAGEKGLVWTEAEIVSYIEDPTVFLRTYLDDPKAKSGMTFKLKDQTDRVNIAAYLATTGKPASEEEAAAAKANPDATAVMSDEEVISGQVFKPEFMDDLANIEAGKEIWFAQCTHCHGFKAYPGKAPKLKPAKYTPEFVFKRAYKGFKKMPPWKDVYSIDELRQIVAYVKSRGFAP